MIFAPVLTEVAAGLSGSAATLDGDAVKWAYALRDAVELVRPDWIVTHHDPELEARALSNAGIAVGDVYDAELAELRTPAAVLTAAATLAAIYPGREVAASTTGPATLAARIAASAGLGAGSDEALDLLDGCADAIAAYAAALADAGATRIVVWETQPGAFAAADLAAAQQPLVRRLGTIALPAVLCHRGDVPATGYAAVAAPGAGLVDPRAFDGVASFDEVLARTDATADLFITDGAIAATCDPAVLRSAGQRGTAITDHA